MAQRWVVICCEVAGKKTGGKVTREELVPAMEAAGLEVEVVYTEPRPEGEAHAVELAKLHGSPQCGLIAVGGDGTIHEVMEGLIAAGKLAQVPLGLLSQGTVNAYAISADLPSASELPAAIAAKSVRQRSLMHITSDDGKVDTRCFQAVYIGLAFNGTKGAQEWRNSFVGPLFGIMKANFRDNLYPETMAVEGTLDMVLKNGQRKTLTDTFTWIVIQMCNPYNGALTDSMWVSYITLEDFPGFDRMMGPPWRPGFLAPVFEFYSGFVGICSGHCEVSSFTWTQTKAGENVPDGCNVCLDGDPVSFGNVMRGKLTPNAWRVVAPPLPKRVKPEFCRQGPETEAAKAWLAANPPPPGVFRTPVGTTPAPKGTPMPASEAESDDELDAEGTPARGKTAVCCGA